MDEKRGIAGSLLKGVTRKSVEALARSFGIQPNDRAWVTMDVGASLASVSIKVATEFFRVVPEVAQHLDNEDLRLWAEVGRRVALDNADEANGFFHHSAQTLAEIPVPLRPLLIALCSKQIVLSPSTALNTFNSAPHTIAKLGETEATQKLWRQTAAPAGPGRPAAVAGRGLRAPLGPGRCRAGAPAGCAPARSGPGRSAIWHGPAAGGRRTVGDRLAGRQCGPGPDSDLSSAAAACAETAADALASPWLARSAPARARPRAGAG